MSQWDQEPENQLRDLRDYCGRRSWGATEYVDRGVSGAKDRRPALDQLIAAARRRKFDTVVVWRLDRLGRNLRHLILLIDELQALGLAFVSLAERIDATTPAGRLQLHVLTAIAEFERSRIQERVRAGLARVRAQGKRLGRPVVDVPEERAWRRFEVSPCGKPLAGSVSRPRQPTAGCLETPLDFASLNLQNTA